MTVKEGQHFDKLEVEVLEVSEPRTVKTKYGKSIDVANATVKSDETGEIELALWAGNAKAFRSGDRILLENADVNSFRGKLSLNVAHPKKGGKLTRM